MVIGGRLASAILKRYSFSSHETNFYEGKSKLEACLGQDVWKHLEGKRVLDFGCGDGAEVIEIAQRGIAQSVCGVDINQQSLTRAKARAQAAGVMREGMFSDRVPPGSVDVIISLDAFEHYPEPDLILQTMHDLLTPNGCVLVSFGPPWYHPLGSHIVLFPWSHMVLKERAILRWRSQFKTDGATRYEEVENGLNRMTIQRFTRLVRESGFGLRQLDPVPIRGLRRLHNRLTREFTSALVRSELRKAIP